ncbi:MAG: InlB B-repeat-containing protein, partial [Ruminococcus sp.]|nr:InlB B-repeat-containing protein [Ruminococcus sp.]
MKKKAFTKVLSTVLALVIALSCMAVAVVPVSAATYRNGAQSGPSTSYKNGKYYKHYQKVPITGDNRTDLVAMALSQLGYQEGAANGNFSGEVSGRANYVEFSYNMGDLGLGYGGSDYPWCASFVSWCLYQSRCTDQGTYSSLGRYHKGDYDYIWKEISCSQWVSQLKGAGYFKYSKYEGGTYTPKYGDLVYFQNSGGVAHIGICLYTSGGRIYTVEGNTSDASGLEANGGGVYFKNYSLSSSYLYGYGVLPYKTNSSVPKIDYSGANPTPGLYVSNAAKYIYSSETASSYSYTIPRFSMFEITKIGSNGRLYGTFTTSSGATVTGWINNNSDRIIQLSSSDDGASALELAKEDLKKVVNTAKDIRHYNYTEAKLLEIRSAYKSAVALLSDTSATESQVTSAKNTLSSLLTQTGTNTIAFNNKGVYVNGRNSYIGAGDCFIYSPSWNNGLITVDNANIRYTVNVVVGWNSYLNCNIVKSVSEGIGSSTPSIQIEEGEWLIAAHDWERGVSDADNPVEYSGTNYVTLAGLEVGTKVYLSGATTLNSGTDVEPGAFIKFAPPEAVKMTGKNVKVEKGGFVLFTPDFNGGLITPANSNIHKTLNVVARWNDEKAAWVVADMFHGDGSEDESSNITIADGQVVISGYAWEGGVTDGTAVAGSTINWNFLNNAEVGQQVVFSGITPNYGADYLSVSANISFVDIESDDEGGESGGTEQPDEGEEEEIPVSTLISQGKAYDVITTDSAHLANLTDGVYPDALWPSGNWFGFNKEKNTTDGVGYVTVDLGARHNIESYRAHLYPSDDASSIGIPAYIKVYTSDNGADFTYAGELSVDSEATVAYWADLKTTETIQGRYVRFEVAPSDAGHYWVFLNEVEVYGTEISDRVNLASGTSVVTTPENTEYNTSLTDGVAQNTLGTDKWVGYRGVTSSQDEFTSIVDLGGRYSISEIQAHYFAGANDADAAVPQSATVYVSIDGISYAKVGTLLVNNGAAEPFWANISECGAVGRYVKIVTETQEDKWALINEIEVFGVAHNQTVDDNIALEKPFTCPAYPSSPFNASITDGIASEVFQYGLNDSSWFAFRNTGDSTGNTTGEKGIAIIDLGGQAEITGTAVHVLAGTNDLGAVQPGYINVYISDDGVSYDYVETINPQVVSTDTYWMACTFDTPVYARYVKYALGISSGKTVLFNEIKISGTMLTSNESDEPGSMSAVTLAGEFNSWNATPNMQIVSDNLVSISLPLESGTYEFKILDGNIWYGNGDVEIDNTTEAISSEGLMLSEQGYNCKLIATGGTYTFLYDTESKYIRVLHTPETYYIRGTFNEWEATDIMEKISDGVYQKTLTLDAGTYEFKAANEDYTKEWPQFNQSITLDRKTDVTFTLDIFANTLTVTEEINDFIVTFIGRDGSVIDTQIVHRGDSATAPEAPALSGYKFDGWDKSFKNVASDITVKARYTSTTGTLRVNVSGGTGFTISINGGNARPQGTSYYNTRTPMNKSVTLVAKAAEGIEFLGWVNRNMVVLSTEETYTFITTGNDFAKAVYRTDLDGASLVIFKNDKAAGGNGAILDLQYYVAGEEIVIPANPAQAGYDFAGWDMTAEEIAAKVA